jgi:dihydroorotate dehydrogenase electron transfer subunit
MISTFEGKVLSNKKICCDCYELKFEWKKTADVPVPGQFFTVGNLEGVFLRRPFAFSNFDEKKKIATMIFQKRGKGTEDLTTKKRKDYLNIFGPLGEKLFPMPDKGQESLLIAGGIGLGPLLFLAHRIYKIKSPITFIFGCRTKDFITSNLSSFKPIICTDDGSKGFKGTIGDYLKSDKNIITDNTVIYACGPKPVLKSCHEFAIQHNCECFVSAEQIIACGIGACLGCAIPSSHGGYVRVCTDGPVFNSKDLKWE